MTTISFRNQAVKIEEIVEAIRVSYAETKERVDLALEGIKFAGPSDLSVLPAKCLKSISIQRCEFDGNLVFSRLDIEDSVHLSQTKIEGALQMDDMTIGGGVALGKCLFKAVSGHGVVLSRTKVGRDLVLSQERARCVFRGGIGLAYTETTGSLICGAVDIRAKEDGHAIEAYQAKVGKDVVINCFGDPKWYVAGKINFWGAQVGGAFNVDALRVENPDDESLIVSASRLQGGLYMRSRGFTAQTAEFPFVSKGTVNMTGAHITGLFADRAVLHSASKISRRVGCAIWAREVHIEGSINFNWKRLTCIETEGALAFPNATITGNVTIGSARLSATGPDAGQNSDFEIDGKAISFQGAKIGGDLKIGRFDKTDEDRTDRVCRIIGLIDLRRADIAGDLAFYNIMISGARRDGAPLLDIVDLSDARIGGRLVPCFETHLDDCYGRINLEGASVATIEDRNGVGWGHMPDHAGTRQSIRLGVQLLMNGLTYRRLDDQFAGQGDLKSFRDRARRRRSWLQRAYFGKKPGRGDFYAQPYIQLSNYYQEHGQRMDSRRVLIDMNDLHARAGLEGWFEWTRNRLYALLFCYGLSPGQALSVCIGTFLIGWLATYAFELNAKPEVTLIQSAAFVLSKTLAIFGDGDKDLIKDTRPAFQIFVHLYRLTSYIVVSITAISFSGILGKAK